jgi:hypothetical protein
METEETKEEGEEKKDKEKTALSGGKQPEIRTSTEDQAFSLSYELAPSPPLSQVASHFQSSCMSPVELNDEGREWGETKSYNGKKSWSSISHSTIYVNSCPLLLTSPFRSCFELYTNVLVCMKVNILH